MSAPHAHRPFQGHIPKMSPCVRDRTSELSVLFRTLFAIVLIINQLSLHSINALSLKTRSFIRMAVTERTEKVFASMEKALSGNAVGGAGGSSSLEGLKRLDGYWHALKNGGWRQAPKAIVSVNHNKALESGAKVFDVAVCGGTLGIFYALALQNIGYSVCVIERNQIKGRPQEWNISRKELEVLSELGLFTTEELQSMIAIKFNPVRCGFKTDTSPNSSTPGFEVYLNDVLNLGVKPDMLIEMARDKFLATGGVAREGTAIEGIEIGKTYANIQCANPNSSSANGSRIADEDNSAAASVKARLVLDAMGNGSPIARQIRGAVEPDGICVVVGGCARGFDPQNNTYSDVIYTDTPITSKADSKLQYFWEAFPAGSGPADRTTYLFTYMDAKPERPSIAEIIDDYWELLPRYQGKQVEDLAFQRILYGMFPTYRASPLQCGFDRVLQVGDASGIQSPLSFGGFGSLTRHLPRIRTALRAALDNDFLTAEDLSLINPYQPNLSACWMFQRSMSVPIGKDPRGDLVIGTLANSFSSMEFLGEEVMRPFLQDVLQFVPLLRTLSLAFKRDLLIPVKIVPYVGVGAIADFLFHFAALGVYTLLFRSLGPALSSIAEAEGTDARTRYRLLRQVEAWKFGSGLDYDDH